MYADADPIKIVLWVTSTRIYTSLGIDSKYYCMALIIHISYLLISAKGLNMEMFCISLSQPVTGEPESVSGPT